MGKGCSAPHRPETHSVEENICLIISIKHHEHNSLKPSNTAAGVVGQWAHPSRPAISLNAPAPGPTSRHRAGMDDGKGPGSWNREQASRQKKEKLKKKKKEPNSWVTGAGEPCVGPRRGSQQLRPRPRPRPLPQPVIAMNKQAGARGPPGSGGKLLGHCHLWLSRLSSPATHVRLPPITSAPDPCISTAGVGIPLACWRVASPLPRDSAQRYGVRSAACRIERSTSFVRLRRP